MLTIFTAGFGNAESSGYGVSILRDREEVAALQGELPFGTTLNQSAYYALLVGLEWAVKAGDSVLTVNCENIGVARQVRGEWAVKNSAIRLLWAQVVARIKTLRETKTVYELQVLPSPRAHELAQEARTQGIPDLSEFQQLLTRGVQGQRGYEALIEEIQRELAYRHVLMEPYISLKNGQVRRALHERPSLSSRMLLWTPHLVAISQTTGPVLLLANTSFVMQDGVGLPVVSVEAWESTLGYADSGHDIYMAYRPYTRGRWCARQELNWGIGSTQVEVTHVGAINTHQIPTPSGWDEVYQIFSDDWTPLREWVTKTLL